MAVGLYDNDLLSFISIYWEEQTDKKVSQVIVKGNDCGHNFQLPYDSAVCAGTVQSQKIRAHPNTTLVERFAAI